MTSIDVQHRASREFALHQEEDGLRYVLRQLRTLTNIDSGDLHTVPAQTRASYLEALLGPPSDHYLCASREHLSCDLQSYSRAATRPSGWNLEFRYSVAFTRQPDWD
jgi:hypothetical protein